MTDIAKSGILLPMRKTKLGLVEVEIKGKRFRQVVVPKPGGGRIRRTFKNKREAETAHEQAKVAFENHGRAVFNISEGLRVEALECARQLQEFNATLSDATRFYVEPPSNCFSKQIG